MEEEQPSGEATRREESVTDINSLPEGCISNILSFTSPLNACTSSVVSPIFRSAANSDSLWEKFLPCDYRSIISQSDNFSFLNFHSKKELFFTLCLNPLLIDDGKKRFWLEKQSGKKCYMLGAIDLFIMWGTDPRYWVWKRQRNCRFSEVCELKSVWWFEIRSKIDTSMLSPTTAYAVYLVFKMKRGASGFKYPYKASVGTAITENRISSVCLAPNLNRGDQQPDYVAWNFPGLAFDVNNLLNLPQPKKRSDGWLEVKLGEYFNQHGEDGELEMSIMEVEAGIHKSGIVVLGIEIRPK